MRQCKILALQECAKVRVTSLGQGDLLKQTALILPHLPNLDSIFECACVAPCRQPLQLPQEVGRRHTYPPLQAHRSWNTSVDLDLIILRRPSLAPCLLGKTARKWYVLRGDWLVNACHHNHLYEGSKNITSPRSKTLRITPNLAAPALLQCPFGLYAEQVNGTAFTVPRARNQRSYVRQTCLLELTLLWLDARAAVQIRPALSAHSMGQWLRSTCY